MAGTQRAPRAVIHKRILDVAREQPEASMAKIADEVSGASTDLVERVLTEYGDPVAEVQSGMAESASTTGMDEQPTDSPTPDEADLTEKQREVLRAIYEHPDASQQDIGQLLDVSASTVSNRLASVDGFEWEDRWQFVNGLFEADRAPEADALAELRRRVDDLESGGPVDGPGSQPFDPDLAHKVAHACMASERISEEEELEVLRVLMGEG